MLIGEITSIHYDDERPDGTIKIESKKDLRTRGLESTNRLDALALTEYYDWPMLRALDMQRSRPKPVRKVSWRTV